MSLRVLGADTAATDVVGRLAAWGDGTLTVVRRDGRTVDVPAAALLAGLVVAPEWGAHDLQRVAQDGWRPAETRVWGDWALRWSDGVSERANSTRVGADPGADVGAGLAIVTSWYAERGGRPLLQVPTPSVHDDAFDAAGWAVTRRVRFLQAATSSLAAGAVPGVDVTIASEPDAGWLAAMDEPAAQRAGYAAILRRSPLACYATATLAGGLVGIARATVGAGRGRRSADRVAGVSSVHVLPHARRRGVATACMAALARWASTHGADLTCLQVLDVNTPALAFYESLGFTLHHRYAYRSPSGTRAPWSD